MVKKIEFILLMMISGLIISIINPFDLSSSVISFSKLVNISIIILLIAILLVKNYRVIKEIEQMGFEIITSRFTPIMGRIILVFIVSILMTTIFFSLLWDFKLLIATGFVLIFFLPLGLYMSRMNLVFYNNSEIMITNLSYKYRINGSEVTLIKKIFFRAFKIGFEIKGKKMVKFFHIPSPSFQEEYNSYVPGELTTMIDVLDIHSKFMSSSL
ncbi:hypothetical protein [Ekhidna sp.]|uniref:hypothetical protein n=1 Tax=Ekhidna sp. TaxID=2608089 RepID=UPI003298B134